MYKYMYTYMYTTHKLRIRLSQTRDLPTLRICCSTLLGARNTRHRLPPQGSVTANLCTNIMDFRGFDSRIIFILRGWNSQVHREFPVRIDSSNVSRRDVSRRIGRRLRHALSALNDFHLSFGVNDITQYHNIP